MPYSDDSNVGDVRRYLLDTQPLSVLDVGAGAGKYGRMVRQTLPSSTVHAVEIWGPYVKDFGLKGIYHHVFNHDIRDWTADDFGAYDLVIFGDILEHMTKEEAVEVFSNVLGSLLISIPTTHYPQGHSHGNPYEEHVKDDWSTEEILDTFPVQLWAQYETTATFYRDGPCTASEIHV